MTSPTSERELLRGMTDLNVGPNPLITGSITR